ncbi:MAG: hypothetical protein QXU98_09325 [Candidatus Parvarchaeota archaeon]
MDKKIALGLIGVAVVGLAVYEVTKTKATTTSPSSILSPSSTPTPTTMKPTTMSPFTSPPYTLRTSTFTSPSIMTVTSSTTITSSTTVYVPTNVLVVAVGGGGAGAGTTQPVAYAGRTVWWSCQAGNGGNTIVTNGNQTITAGGGQGGWSGYYDWTSNGPPTGGRGGAGGTGLASVKYYQILNGNAGSRGGYETGGSGAAIPSGYNTAIQQVLSAFGYSSTFSLSIPSTPGTNSRGGSGYGAGGGGSAVGLGGGGGGGSGAVVVGIMSPGTFNITVAPLNTQITTCAVYRNSSYAYGMPGVVYLIPLLE